MSNIQIIKPGYFDSIQDMGRFGYRDIGVPTAGVMDVCSAKLANALLENDLQCAVLEMTLTGPTLLFQDDALISITGADMSAALNNIPVKPQTKLNVKVGDILAFDKSKYGCRAYLAVKNGFKTEYILNSFSHYKGITKVYMLNKGDELAIAKQSKDTTFCNAHVKIDVKHFKTDIIETNKGPEFDLLSKNQQTYLLNNLFKIKLNSRMGYQFRSTKKLGHQFEILTSSVMPGTVQLTQSGKLIVLMKDCQTTGGYPRILQLSEKGISVLAQKNTFQKVYFKLK